MKSISILSIKSRSFPGQQKPHFAALHMYFESFWKPLTGDRSVSNATNTSLHHSLKEYGKNGEGGSRGEVHAGLREQMQGRGQATLQEESWQWKKRVYIREKREKCHFLYSIPENLSVQFSCMLYYTNLSISPRAGLHRRNPLGPCQCIPQSLPSAKHNTFHVG